MDSPQISRSGRVLKKSAKVKEMEDLEIPEFELQGKPRKKSKGMDDFDEFDDKRVAPIKIPKISLNISTSPAKKKISEVSPSLSKIPAFPSPVKTKLDPRSPLFQESSPEAFKESDSSQSSSETSTTSSSSSDDSDSDMHDVRQKFQNVDMKPTILQNIQRLPVSVPQEKVVVESFRQFDSPMSFVDHHNEPSMDVSEDETSESNLVIAEESNDSPGLPKGQKTAAKRKPVKKESPVASRNKVLKKKPPPKETKSPPKKKKPEGRSKPLTAYMLWCTENRKRIAAQGGGLGFASIGKKMGEAWQALPDKEKMAWRRKAKKLALKGSSLISTGPINESSTKVVNHSSSSMSDDLFKGLSDITKTAGTSPIDAAAYLKLLGESLSVIGQRLTEHEGQLAVSGIFSVLLDSILCVVAPLLCLTTETPVLNSCPQEVCRRTLDNIAYFMPGL